MQADEEADVLQSWNAVHARGYDYGGHGGEGYHHSRPSHYGGGGGGGGWKGEHGGYGYDNGGHYPSGHSDGYGHGYEHGHGHEVSVVGLSLGASSVDGSWVRGRADQL